MTGFDHIEAPIALGALPSEDHAIQLVEHPSPKTVVQIVGDVLFRASLIGAGLAAAGVRRRLVAGAVCGSLVVETFVLTWVAAEKAG